MIAKTDFDAKLLSLNRKVTKNKTENLLVKKDLDQLKTFDSSYFIGKSHFEDGTQNCLVFSEPSTFALHCGDFSVFCIFYFLFFALTKNTKTEISKKVTFFPLDVF